MGDPRLQSCPISWWRHILGPGCRTMSLSEIKPKVIIVVSLIVYVVYIVIILSAYRFIFPYQEVITPIREAENLKIWGYRLLFGKIFSLIVTFIAGLLVGRFTPRENRNYLNGVIVGLLFSMYGILLYVARFGIENYLKYHNIALTTLYSIILGGFGFWLYKELFMRIEE
jgi:uncharacterized membrane protein YeaQ/YmgE (transglycosylase-associated protein family)